MTKARGKSGPLFDFDVREDIRMIHDATVEKQEVKSQEKKSQQINNNRIYLIFFAL